MTGARRTRCWPLAVALPLCSALVVAQPAKPVYRCANGSYADTPCAAGTALSVDDARTPAQQAQAREAAQREANLAARQAAERQALEAAARRHPAPLAGIGVPAKAASAPHHAASKAKHHLSAAERERRAEAKQARKDAPPKSGATKDGRMGQY
jgi:hypothetical protein